MKKTILALGVSLSALIWLTNLYAATHSTTLANGLKVIVKEDHRAPIVVSQVWYKVGSSYEHRGITGISHVVEHMMFKGTDKYPDDAISQTVSKLGGSFNAFTGQDYTAYYEVFEKSVWPIAFELEADRMQNLRLRQEDFAKEIEVVKEERRLRTDDVPQGLMYERLLATAHLASPYHNPTIGWMDDLDNMTLDMLKAWYKKWYAPNNATVVVVGDVDPEQVFDLAREHFGAIKASKLEEAKAFSETWPLGKRQIQVKLEAVQVPVVYLSYNVPVIKTVKQSWEPYALEVLAGILGGGNSARLQKTLVLDKKIASGVNAGYDPFSKHDDLFIIAAEPVATSSLADIMHEIDVETGKLKDELIGTVELEKIKTQVVAAKTFALDSLQQQASEIGSLESVSLPWQLADDYVKQIQNVTAEQVQQVARKYLIEERLTIAELLPTS